MLNEAGLPAVYVGGDVYDRADALSQLSRKEVVVGMSPLSGPSGVARALQHARGEGAVTLACTPSLNSHAARATDHLLYAPGESETGMPSLTGLYSLLTAIALSLAERDPAAVAQRRSLANRALEELI
jgi:DNA-binding MurR/RpiR family transcriptional regulator